MGKLVLGESSPTVLFAAGFAQEVFCGILVWANAFELMVYVATPFEWPIVEPSRETPLLDSSTVLG